MSKYMLLCDTISVRYQELKSKKSRKYAPLQMIYGHATLIYQWLRQRGSIAVISNTQYCFKDLGQVPSENITESTFCYSCRSTTESYKKGTFEYNPGIFWVKFLDIFSYLSIEHKLNINRRNISHSGIILLAQLCPVHRQGSG